MKFWLLFTEPSEWKPRRHLGIKYNELDEFTLQVIDHFDVAVQQIELLRLRQRIQAVLISILLLGFGVLLAVNWPALTPLVKKLIE